MPRVAEVVQHLRAYWRGEPNGKRGMWAVCPVCRDAESPSLGMGTYIDGTMRLWCWNEDCGAMDEQVLRALGFRARVPMPWRAVEPPRVIVPGERWAA